MFAINEHAPATLGATFTIINDIAISTKPTNEAKYIILLKPPLFDISNSTPLNFKYFNTF